MKSLIAATVALIGIFVSPEAHAQYSIDDLTKACGEGDMNRVISILDSGVNINAKDSKGWFPISKAAVNGQDDVLYILISRRADVDITTRRQNTPMLFAASRGHEEAVRLLLNAGANSFIANVDREVPESIARAKGYPRIAEMIYDFQRR